jgi:AcrR family transcriptional regulator
MSVKAALAKPTKITAPRRRATSRPAIIAAAAKLFAKIGYSKCEMDTIAAKLGVAKGTLYLHFASKEELFSACVDDGLARSRQAMAKATAQEPDLLKQLALAIQAYLTFFDRNPHCVELVLQERALFRSRRPRSYFKNRDINRTRWREVYEQLIRQKRFRNDLPVDRILDVVGNILYGAIFTNYFSGKSASSKEQFDAIWKVLMQGLSLTASNSGQSSTGAAQR